MADQFLPIVYSPRYDITLLGFEKLHPFDSAKYGRVFKYLKEKGILTGKNHHEPGMVDEETLLKVHSARYLKLIRKSQSIAAIAEVPAFKWIPAILLRCRLLKPMRRATHGTILGAELALREGWAINLSGGYHHAKRENSGGFCFYADIPLAAYQVWETNPDTKIMVVDLDAHQGNGFEAIFEDDPRVVTFDLYNGQIYPSDLPAAKFIRYNHPIKSGTNTETYLKKLEENLAPAIEKEQPDLVIYNAGTDIYEKDPLGALKVSEAGVIARDEHVFNLCLERKIPILMLLSGGYTQESWQLIGKSIENLWDKILKDQRDGQLA